MQTVRAEPKYTQQKKATQTGLVPPTHCTFTWLAHAQGCTAGPQPKHKRTLRTLKQLKEEPPEQRCIGLLHEPTQPPWPQPRMRQSKRKAALK